MLLVFDAICFLVAVIVLAEALLTFRQTAAIDEEPLAEPGAPSLSIIVAARNEARSVADALTSVLAQQYPDLEVIVVNDRSTDTTGDILRGLEREHPALRVLTIDDLPTGWIGKNHALFRGAREARGEFLLFTDADVVFAPTAVSRAMHFMLRQRLDHLTLAPELELRTAPLALVVNYFLVVFSLYMRPRKAPDPRSRHHIGIGAFNLVRASAYRAAGTHQRIALRPDDDIKLGKLLKQSGARQQAASGRHLLRVRWYDSLGEMIHGLRKNAFAGLGYRVSLLLAATVATLAFHVWPFAAPWITHGWNRALMLATAGLLMATYALSAHHQRTRPWLAPAFPLAALIFLYIVWASAIVTLVRRGVVWRGTWYPLSDLRRNRI